VTESQKKYESRKTHYWTETEDELFISLVDFHFDGAPSSHTDDNWVIIAERLAGRTKKACKVRLHRIEKI
jgi:hypothetical protein